MRYNLGKILLLTFILLYFITYCGLLLKSRNDPAVTFAKQAALNNQQIKSKIGEFKKLAWYNYSFRKRLARKKSKLYEVYLPIIGSHGKSLVKVRVNQKASQSGYDLVSIVEINKDKKVKIFKQS